MLKKMLFFIVILNNSLTIFCQDNTLNIYIDEHNNNIDLKTYIKKHMAFAFESETKIIDSIKINKINQKFKFDKLSQVEKTQLLDIIKKNIGKSFNHSQTILISNTNTIYGFEARKKRQEVFINTDTTGRKIVKLTKSKYISYQKKHDIKQKKCFKKFREKNIEPVLTYEKDEGYDYNPKHFTWHKTTINLNTIFKNNKITKNNIVIVIKPNGEYFLSNIPVPSSILLEIIDNNNWEKSKLQLTKSLETNSKAGIGIFNQFYELINSRKHQRVIIIKDPKRRKDLEQYYKTNNPNIFVVSSYGEMMNVFPYLNYCFTNDH